MDLKTRKTWDRLAHKLLRLFFFVAIFLIAIFLISKIFIPSSDDGWSVIPTIDIILMSGYFLCFFCMMGISCYQGWTKNVDEYYEWFYSYSKRLPPTSKFIRFFYPKWMYLWAVRLVPIIFFIAVLSLLGVKLLNLS